MSGSPLLGAYKGENFKKIVFVTLRSSKRLPFRRTILLASSGLKSKPKKKTARNRHHVARPFLCLFWNFVWFNLQPLKWRRYVLPKRRALLKLRGDTNQNTGLFVVTGVRTSDSVKRRLVPAFQPQLAAID
jgi:hypothetical protein